MYRVEFRCQRLKLDASSFGFLSFPCLFRSKYRYWNRRPWQTLPYVLDVMSIHEKFVVVSFSISMLANAKVAFSFLQTSSLLGATLHKWSTMQLCIKHRPFNVGLWFVHVNICHPYLSWSVERGWCTATIEGITTSWLENFRQPFCLFLDCIRQEALILAVLWDFQLVGQDC